MPEPPLGDAGFAARVGFAVAADFGETAGWEPAARAPPIDVPPEDEGGGGGGGGGVGELVIEEDTIVERNMNTRRIRSRFSLGVGARFQYRCSIGFSILALTVFSTLMLMARTATADVDALAVQRSIDRGVEYLRKTQNDRGGWNEFGNQSCGLSALCTLAWVNSGVSREDPDLGRALNYLRGFEPDETYSVALQTLVFCQVGAAEDVRRIYRNVELLTKQQKPAGERFAGAWTYGSGRGNGDPSNAQFAVLALGAAADRGIEIDPTVFESAAQYWRGIQLRGGGWTYGGTTPSGSMTCAGIASMIICGESLRDLNESDSPKLQCCGRGERDDTVQRGLDYLSRVFTVRANPGGELLSYFYYLYAVERVGRLSGRRLIGNRDWYREGAERLVGLQDGFQGFWQGGGPVESNRDIATSFALLFLAKGKRQVVIGRLDHPSTRDGGGVVRGGIVAKVNPANEESTASPPHPTSLQTLVRHVEKSWSRELTWQNIVAEQATVEDLLQTPVLVISGGSELRFDDALSKRLKEYLDQGGTILFDALAGDGCGSDEAFRRSVVDLCDRWYPTSPLLTLPPSHPVWFAERFVDPTAIIGKNGTAVEMLGVQACCRTPIFYSPQSLMCRWSYGGPLLRKVDLPASIQGQVVAGITIGENILAYATGRELKDKLDAVNQIKADDAPVPTRGAIPIAVAALGAGERQVNQALPNAAAIIRDRLSIEVIAVNQPIALTDESLSRVGVLYLTGQTEFVLQRGEREALKNYIERGGIVLASPICGEQAFGDAVRRELQSIAGREFETLPKDHPAFGTRFGGYDVSRVVIRRPVRRQKNDNRVGGEPITLSRRTDAPIIESIATDGIDHVFYSPLDLSCALESRNSIQCPGYSTEDAARIMAGLILYGLNQ